MSDHALADRLLDVTTVATWLAVNRRAVYFLVRTKQLPVRRVGKLFRFRREDIETFISAGGTPLSDTRRMRRPPKQARPNG